jgi:aryl-alcohol dehydrogenase-like predicted oxidoreductase
MRPHDFHQAALATGEMDIMLFFNDFNLLRHDRAEALLAEAARRDVGVLNGWSIVRGLLTGADPDEAAKRGRYGDQADVERAKRIRAWCQERGVSLLALALQFCLRETRIHGNPLGSQNVRELEANVAAVSDTLPAGVIEEFQAAKL